MLYNMVKIWTYLKLSDCEHLPLLLCVVLLCYKNNNPVSKMVSLKKSTNILTYEYKEPMCKWEFIE